MKKTVAFVVMFVFVFLAYAGTTLAIVDTIGGEEIKAAEEFPIIKDGNLVIYGIKQVILDVPKGVPPEEALALYKGEIPNYTAKGKEQTRYLFSFPVKKETVGFSWIISYYHQQGRWNEEPKTNWSVKNDWFRTFLAIILPLFGILLITIDNRRKRNREIKLALSFLAILLYAALGSHSATSDIFFLLGFFACAITGLIAGGAGSMFAAAMTGLATNWFIGQTDNAIQYLLLIAGACIFSYLVALIVGRILLAKEAKHLTEKAERWERKKAMGIRQRP